MKDWRDNFTDEELEDIARDEAKPDRDCSTQCDCGNCMECLGMSNSDFF